LVVGRVEAEVRSKPKGVRRFTREQLLQTMRKFVRDNARRDAGMNWAGVPVEMERSRYYCCGRLVKRGHAHGCKVRELLWNIEFDLWLSKPM
jgi:hypothetical protein